MRHRPLPTASVGIAVLAVMALPALLGGRRRRRRPHSYGKELATYRRDLSARTTMIDSQLATLGDLVDALRRHDADPDEAVLKLEAGEEELDAAADALRDFLAPEELHALHAEYEGNLERALRGIVTAERGCGITRMRHRPPDDDEPFVYWKRGHLNIVHARMRMRELAEALLTWEPGMIPEATVSVRLPREAE
jgi:hypothetical protein